TTLRFSTGPSQRQVSAAAWSIPGHCTRDQSGEAQTLSIADDFLGQRATDLRGGNLSCAKSSKTGRAAVAWLPYNPAAVATVQRFPEQDWRPYDSSAPAADRVRSRARRERRSRACRSGLQARRRPLRGERGAVPYGAVADLYGRSRVGRHPGDVRLRDDDGGLIAAGRRSDGLLLHRTE